MLIVHWILLHLLSIFGFFLAMTLLVHQTRERRSPSSTIAWLLAIVLIPYVGVPAYVFFGGRKIKSMTKSKADLASGIDSAGERISAKGVGSVFPQRDGNRVLLLATGEEAYRALVNLIEHAVKSIDIATFILSNDETGAAILSALALKAKQGVTVRLLLDAVGAFRISQRVLAPLADAGGRYAFFMPMMHLPFRGRANLRNHRKIIIIDDATAMVGGMNIAREYMGATTAKGYWSDLSLIVKGPALADLGHIFNADWQFAAKQETAEKKIASSVDLDAVTTLQIVPSGPDVAGDPLHDDIIGMLFKAQHRVWIVTPYFIPDEMLLKAICLAARRGIDVRIVVPRVSNHPLADLVRRSYLREAQDSGASVCNFTPGMMHGKVILIDDSFGVVGSMNMDMRSFFLNYEVGLFIYDEKVVKELDNWVKGLLGQTVQGIKKANVVVSFFEGIARLLAPLL